MILKILSLVISGVLIRFTVKAIERFLEIVEIKKIREEIGVQGRQRISSQKPVTLQPQYIKDTDTKGTIQRDWTGCRLTEYKTGYGYRCNIDEIKY